MTLPYGLVAVELILTLMPQWQQAVKCHYTNCLLHKSAKRQRNIFITDQTQPLIVNFRPFHVTIQI